MATRVSSWLGLIKRKLSNASDDSDHPLNHRVITREECRDKLSRNWTSRRKWAILWIIFFVQISMNFNASIYPNAYTGLSEKYGVDKDIFRWGQFGFLVAYALGCELWAPWSEEYGRFWTLQGSLLLVNVWQILDLTSPTSYGVVIGRVLGGLSSAGGSVTLGMVADMFTPDKQQYAVNFLVLSSVSGGICGPIIGGFLEQFASVESIFIIQLALGFLVQSVHFFFVEETRESAIMSEEAKSHRKVGNPIYSPQELAPGLSLSKIIKIWAKPFIMFATEPIVLCLSLLSGFSDALIFTSLDSFGLVYSQWGFTPYMKGLTFIPIGLGYIAAWLIFLPFIKRDISKRTNNHALAPESRLLALTWLAPLLPVGLIGFAFSSGGPPLHWIVSMVPSFLIGIANYAIYMATIDYMIAAYGEECSASATGGNGFARDFLAGVAATYSVPFFKRWAAPNTYRFPSFILAGIAAIGIIPVYIFYFKGEWFRQRSKIFQKIEAAREADVNTSGVVESEMSQTGFSARISA